MPHRPLADCSNADASTCMHESPPTPPLRPYRSAAQVNIGVFCSWNPPLQYQSALNNAQCRSPPRICPCRRRRQQRRRHSDDHYGDHSWRVQCHHLPLIITSRSSSPPAHHHLQSISSSSASPPPGRAATRYTLRASLIPEEVYDGYDAQLPMAPAGELGRDDSAPDYLADRDVTTACNR